LTKARCKSANSLFLFGTLGRFFKQTDVIYCQTNLTCHLIQKTFFQFIPFCVAFSRNRNIPNFLSAQDDWSSDHIFIGRR
jgi:hypothetical protein